MQNSTFPWVCNYTHMVIIHEAEVLKVSGGSWTSGMQILLGVRGASDGHVLSPVTQQKATWLGLNPFSFWLWHGLVLLLNVCSGALGFAVLPQSWSVLWGAVKRAETWCRVHQGAETWLCLTPCWKSSEILKLSILSSQYFPASCHLYAHSTYRSILKDWNVSTYSLSISWKRNSRIMYWCMTVEQN